MKRKQIRTIQDFTKFFNLPSDKTDDEVLKLIFGQLEKVPYNPFPTAFHTVDVIAITTGFLGDKSILLGRKPNAIKWQFIGGFVEPTYTAEETAVKEFYEEASVIIHQGRFKYVTSMWIDDERYKNSPHQITSSLFVVELTPEEAGLVKGGDDIEFVEWFSIGDVFINIKENHKKLFNKFLNTIL
jgi:8-oxo-dGTP pyrophosphatase MutT (NUDIX family)